MRYPFIALCISFCLGILSAAYLKASFILFYSLALLFLVLSLIYLKNDKRFNLLVIFVGFFLGASILKSAQVLPTDHIANFARYKSKPACVVGIVESDPIQQKKWLSFALKVEHLGIDDHWQKGCGKTQIRIFDKGEFFYGDRVLLEGRLYRDPKDYLRYQNIYSILSVKKGSRIKPLGKGSVNPVKYLAFRIRHRIREVIVRHLSPFSAGIFNALILGQRQDLAPHLKDILIKSGSVHIIAISGLHLGIVAFMLLVVLKAIRIPKKAQYLLVIILLVLYCIMTGARTPVVRATIMAIILILSHLFERKSNIYNSLSLAALIILLVNPYQLFGISFQLSFMSVISIVYLGPKIRSIFGTKLPKIRWMNSLIVAFSASTAAWLGLLPLIAYNFGIISPVTVLANMIIVPYMPLVLASGFTLILVGVVFPPLAGVFAASCEFFIQLLFKVASVLVSIPGAYFMLPRIPLGYVLLYYCLLILVFISLKSIKWYNKSP